MGTKVIGDKTTRELLKEIARLQKDNDRLRQLLADQGKIIQKLTAAMPRGKK
jgi:hypothetical protein